MVNYSSAKLKLAYKIQRTIESLQAKLHKHANKLAIVLGGEMPVPFRKGKNKMSAAGRARIAASQRARWAEVKRKGGKPAKKGKRTMSAAAKAKIAKAARLRWKKAKAAGKNRL